MKHCESITLRLNECEIVHFVPGPCSDSTRLAISLRDRISFRISSGMKIAEESCVRGCIFATLDAGPG